MKERESMRCCDDFEEFRVVPSDSGTLLSSSIFPSCVLSSLRGKMILMLMAKVFPFLLKTQADWDHNCHFVLREVRRRKSDSWLIAVSPLVISCDPLVCLTVSHTRSHSRTSTLSSSSSSFFRLDHPSAVSYGLVLLQVLCDVCMTLISSSHHPPSSFCISTSRPTHSSESSCCDSSHSDSLFSPSELFFLLVSSWLHCIWFPSRIWLQHLKRYFPRTVPSFLIIFIELHLNGLKVLLYDTPFESSLIPSHHLPPFKVLISFSCVTCPIDTLFDVISTAAYINVNQSKKERAHQTLTSHLKEVLLTVDTSSAWCFNLPLNNS